ncbi:MAG: hypothetical protein QG635_1612, partial [Bacteroidota bacterium]|nr:hypothetical protein [Bacteroidota bacterium]
MDYNTTVGIIFFIVALAAFLLLIRNLQKILSYLKVGLPDNRYDKPLERIFNMFRVAFLQTRIFREKPAGLIHAFIFWGFLALLFSASESLIQGFYHSFNWSFLGPLFTLITVSTDIFCTLVFISVIVSLIRRYVIKVPRLQGDAEEVRDALIVLGSILIIVTSLMLEKAAFTVIIPHSKWAFYPIAAQLGNIYNHDNAILFYQIFWWVHIVAIFGFMNYLPFSKHFHVYTSIPNVYFSYTKPVNHLEKIDFEQEGVEKFGVVDIDDLSWKSLLDGYSCTHCGRCTSVCPANLTGKELSPREIIVQIRHRTKEAGPIMLKKSDAAKAGREITISENEQQILDKKFVGEYESVDALWQCTTCGACMQECPILIEHVPAIVGMRRSLVMMESNFPPLLQAAFSNMENNSSPWAFSQSERGDWAIGTGVKTAAENPDFDILFWVGCSGSYDDRGKKISLAFSKLLQIAGVNFAILGAEEGCTGDPARRTGNEYLADMLVKMNVETLNRYNVKKIVTFCPHCFNTIKNEYPQFGGRYEVWHHTEYLMQLIRDGKLKIKDNNLSPQKVAYHDSCYLGRYNNIYEEPRDIIGMMPSLHIEEAKRSRDKGLCCGAGGGQMFLEETIGKRVNIERTEELLEKDPNVIALNCPFCM